MLRFALLLVISSGCATSRARTQVGDLGVVTFRRNYNNAHAIRLPEGVVLVDAGLEGDAPALARDLRRAGIDPSRLLLVVVTHGHADHAGGAGWLQRELGVPVLAGAGDASLLAAGHNDPLCPTDRAAQRRLAKAQAQVFTPLQADYQVSAPMNLASIGLRGVVTPVTGHTGGSLAFEVGGAMFAGDLLRGSVTGSAAVEHFYQCDPEAASADVAALLRTSGAETWFVGHFGPLSRVDVAKFVAAPAGRARTKPGSGGP